jgi:hypothetical protein
VGFCSCALYASLNCNELLTIIMLRFTSCFFQIFVWLSRWETNSCGYHGDDGNLYSGHGKGETFGPTFTTNDTVGAGINYASQEFFFT